MVDVDGESGPVVTTKSGPPGYDLGRDDIRMSFILCAKWCEIDVGVRVTCCDIETRCVVVVFSRGRAVVGRFPFKDPTIAKEIDCERLFRKSPTFSSLHRSLA
ncbi:hypothetical protein [Halorubrum saccharovorum]|uniref:hypothetical protein n=1 Tax=Halorubrum saccharovorum TaxID=2248 RepID=UPI001F47D742|nr:hypothetical protein [Halorubrum saccharovorum]